MSSITASTSDSQAGLSQRPDFPSASGFPIDRKTIKIAPGSEDAYEAFIDAWRRELEHNWQGGYTQMPDAIRHDPTLSPRAKIVYESLLSFMWFKTDKCFPSQKTLASATGYSVRTVIRALNDLYERGYIEKWRRGQGDTNYYFINPLSFVQSFRVVGRGKGVLLQVNAPECLASVETVPPSDVLSRLRQVVTSENDSVADPELTNWQVNQTNQNQNNLASIHSNHSTTASGEGVGGTAIRNANDEPASSAPTSAKMEGTTPSFTTATPSKPNHIETRKEKLAGPARAKAALLSKMGAQYGGAEAISLATGIPAEHLAEMGVAPERKRRVVPDFIRRVIRDFSVELGDNPRSYKSSVTRATKIYYTMLDIFTDVRDDPEGHFLRAMYDAKTAAKRVTNIRHHTGQQLNRMPAFFTCLENWFKFTPEELEYLHSDAPLYSAC
jgi:hypothetical protein